MALSLTDMFTPATKDEVLEAILVIALVVGLPTTAWQPGSVIREVLEVISQKIADLTTVMAAIASGGLLDFATGGWLTLLAKSAFGLDRIAATFGSTDVDLANSSGVTYVIAAGDLHFVNNVTGKTYTNSTGGTLLLTGGTLTVTVIADESGTDSNAVAAAIDSLITPLLGVTMSNADPLTATDEETDTDLRVRCRESLAAASPNGPRDAYDFFARSAVRLADGSNVGITRTKLTQTTGSLVLYVANAGGVVSGSAFDPTTDLGAVNVKIQASCVPTGMTCSVVSAAQVSVVVEADVYLKSGSSLSSLDAQTLVLDQLNTYFAAVPIGGFDIGGGGFLFLDAIIGQIFQASADIIQVVITLPAADVALLVNEVAVCTSVTGSFTIHF